MTGLPGQAEDPTFATIRRAWTRYAVLLAGLGVLFLLVAIALWPWPHAVVVEYLVLPQYETQFGFRGGRLPIGGGDAAFSPYALVSVVPGGRLALAGARSGDIPLDYHGAFWAFHAALQDASNGREGRFTVLAISDWPERSKLRNVILTPAGHPAPQ
ncbi:MAG: hypothetical protein AB7N24_23625 [Dehalococcoidia bacterium]